MNRDQLCGYLRLFQGEQGEVQRTFELRAAQEVVRAIEARDWLKMMMETNS